MLKEASFVCKFSFDSHRFSHDLVCNLSPADSKSKSFLYSYDYYA